MSRSTRSAVAVCLGLLVVAGFAACGETTEGYWPVTSSDSGELDEDAGSPADAGETNPDDGGTQPDAGNSRPDAGDTKPDAGSETPDAGTTHDAGTTPGCEDTWSTYARSFFSSKCVSCHSWASSYTSVKSRRSLIKTRIGNGSMPQGSPLSTAEKERIINWIDCGLLQ